MGGLRRGDPSGGAATLLLPTGERRGLFVPLAAIARQGDLTGVRVWTGDRAELRWVRLGAVTVTFRGGVTVEEYVYLAPVALRPQ